MLKKVFISLLILSALTSEGVNNTSLDLYSIYVRYAALLDINVQEGMVFDEMSEDDAEFAMLSQMEQELKASITQARNEYTQSGNYYPAMVFQPMDLPLNYSIDTIPVETSSFTCRRDITQLADLSPPFFHV